MIADAQGQLDFIQRVIDETGPRLPCSDAERVGAELIAAEFARATGSPAVIEPFWCAPYASLGFIPVLGFIELFVTIPLFFLAPWVALGLAGAIMAFFFIQIFRYLGWLDFLFPKRRSQNVYAIAEPPSGQVDWTLLISGHIDSSWFCKYFYLGGAAWRIATGVLSGALLIPLALLRGLQAQGLIAWAGDWTLPAILPLVPGFYFVTQLVSWNQAKASQGAADNLSGIASALWVVDHFARYPDQAPKNCRIVPVGFGAEEAGLKGSEAFVKRHRDGLLAGEVWVLNIDNISDTDYFHVIDGDAWLSTRYDEDFCRLAEQSMRAVGLEYQRMLNPIGGSDSAPFSKAGIRTTLINAQDPGPSNRYHTFLDTADAIDPRALTKSNEVLLELIARVDRFVREGSLLTKKVPIRPETAKT
jgi:hypothetical protein